jgi:periplasmic divalent cation tolerance protein
MIEEGTDYLVVLVTASSSEEACQIADELLRRRQAACINIVPEVSSLFWWQGERESAQESLLVIKTRASLFSDIVDLVGRIHSYDVPEIIALPIVRGGPAYMEWLGSEVR